jgi:hypothetical protein
MPHDRLITTLLRSWVWLHLASLVAVLLQPSTPATILGRYSRTSILAFAGLLVTFPAVIIATRWLVRNIERISLRRWQHIAVLIGCTLAIFGCWLINTGPTSSYLIMRLYLTFIVLTLAIWCLRYVTFPAIASRWPLILGVGSCFILLVISARFPPLLWTDEGYMTSVALGFVRTGRPLVLMWQPAQLESFSLTYLGLGIWYQLLGVSLGMGRIFIFVLALISLGFVFAAARRLYSPAAAWFAVILGAFAFLFDNYLRTDIGVAVALSMAFYFFALSRQGNRNWPHLFVGLALGLSLDGHPIAYRFCIAFGMAYLIDYAFLIMERRRFVIYWPVILLIIGGLLGVGAYFGFYATITKTFLSFARSPYTGLSASAILDVLTAHFNAALRLAPLLLGAAIAGIAIALRRRDTADRLLVITIIVPALIIGLFYGFYRDYYLIHSIVPLALLAAGALRELEKHSSQMVTVGFVAILTIACLGWLTQGLVGSTGQGYNQALTVAERIRAVVSRDVAFVGIDPFYFRMYDYPSFVERQAGSWIAKLGNVDERTAWEQIRPTVIAIVRGFPAPPPPALLDYIEDHQLKRVSCWTTEQLGQIDLYVDVSMNPISEIAVQCEILGSQ